MTTTPLAVPQPAGDSKQNVVEVRDLRFGAFLMASGKLRYIGPRIVDRNNGGVVFQFDDPGHVIRDMRIDYNNGGVVGALALFTAADELRDDVSRANGQRPKRQRTPDHDHRGM